MPIYLFYISVSSDVPLIFFADVMRFTELTHRYMTPYEICTQSCLVYFYSDTFSDKSCQIYHNSTHIEAVNCDDKYSAACVYHALPERTKSYCAQVYSINNCKQSEYNTNSACFCEGKLQVS